MRLYNVEQWYRDSINKKDTLVATMSYQLRFPLARSIKRMHETDRTKNYPKGTYFKLV